MAFTRIGSEQAKLKSSRTGDHILDTYLEACELGDRTLYDLLGDVFGIDGLVKADLFEFREDPMNPGQGQVRIGTFTDPEDGWQDMPPIFAAETFFNSPSLTSNTVGIGSKTFTVDTGLSFEPGKWVLITYTVDPTIYMHGAVTSYVTDQLTVNITNRSTVGGTFATWDVSISGTRGAAGADGADALDEVDGGDSLGTPGSIDGGDSLGDTPLGGALIAANNLSDLADNTDARANLGLNSMAIQSAASVAITGGSIVGITDLALADGGTGASTAAAARTNLGVAIGSDVQAFDATLTSIATLGTAANKMIFTVGIDSWQESDLTAFARTLLDDVSAAAMRSTLGLIIGTDVQAQGDSLTSLSNNIDPAGGLEKTGVSTVGTFTITSAGKAILDDADNSAQRTTLGLGTLATQSGTFSGTSSGTNTGDQDLSGLVPNTRTINGQALSSNITLTKSDIGLSNVDNTSDANKPVSTATQTALDLKAPLASPALTGTPTVPTAAVDTNTTQAASAAFVLAQAAATTPIADAQTGVVGTSTRFARADHVHPFATGVVVNSASATYTSNANLTTQIPLDDTIPQITEGTEILSVSITPKSVTNKIRVRFSGFASISAGTDEIACALFQDAIANALNATVVRVAVANTPAIIQLDHEYVPATTSPITIRIRVGPVQAVTVRMNGTTAARYFGGVATSVLIVEEIEA